MKYRKSPFIVPRSNSKKTIKADPDTSKTIFGEYHATLKLYNLKPEISTNKGL